MSGKLDITVGVVKPVKNLGIEQRIDALENPDAVLKSGEILIDDLNVTVPVDTFNWRINQVDFLNIPEYNTTLNPTTEDYIRYDLLVGKSDGTYAIKAGIEGEFTANIPTADVGTIALSVILIQNNLVVEIIPVEPVDLTSIENRLTVIENQIQIPENPETGLLGQAYVFWSGQGLKYDVQFPDYVIQGVLKNSGSGQITLDATTGMTAGHKRYDLIILDANGISKITGVTALDPVLPTINEETQIVLSNILLNAGDIVPANSVTLRKQVYDENIEWTSFKEGAVNINPNYTGFAFKGSKSFQVLNFGSGREHITFVSPVDVNFTDYKLLTFRMYMPSNLKTGGGFDVFFEKNNVRSSYHKTVSHNVYGFNKDLKNTWQLISMPLSAFDITNINFTELVIRRDGDDTNFLLDDIALVKSEEIITNTPITNKGIKTIVTNDGVYTAETPEDIIEIIGINGITVKGSGKKIEIDVKKATDAISGTVKTDIPEADPVVYSKETSDNLLKAKVNAILEIKPITGIAYELTAYDTTNLVELIYEDTLPMTVTIPNDATLNLPVGSIFYTVATNTGALSIAGGVGVTFQTAVGLTAGQNEVRKYVKKAANIWGIEGGAGVVVSTAKTPYTVFIDTVNGNDATAKIEDPTKPFQTNSAALAALPTNNNIPWTFQFIDSGVTRTLSVLSTTRAILYKCDTAGTFDISATPSGTYTSFYFDCPKSTIKHIGSTAYIAYSVAPTNSHLFKLRCKQLWVEGTQIYFSLNALDSVIETEEFYHRNSTNSPIGSGTIKVTKWNTTCASIINNNNLSNPLDLKIYEFACAANTTFAFSKVIQDFPIQKITGTGTISTANINNVDVTYLDVVSTASITLAGTTVLRGRQSSLYLGTIIIANQNSTIAIQDFYGRITVPTGNNTYGVAFNIARSHINLTGALIYSNTSFVWVARTSKIENSIFIQDTPQPLFANFNAATLMTIELYGKNYSNGTLHDGGAAFTVIDKTPNLL